MYNEPVKLDMAQQAREFMGGNHVDVEYIRKYYNKHCAPLVPPGRTYHLQPGDEWCAAFVSVVAFMCGYREGEFPFEVSVWRQRMWAERYNHIGYDPHDCRMNDLVLFNWNGDYVPDHVGICVSNTDGYITTVEGNTNGGQVGYRTLSVQSPLMVAFVHV